MPAMPYFNKNKKPSTLAQLQAQRAETIASRDSQARELAQLRQERVDLATAGEDVDTVRAAGVEILRLADSIELAGSVISNLDATIAPLERAEAERLQLEQRQATTLAHTAALDHATTTAKAVQATFEQVTDELERRFAALDEANLALVLAARNVVSAGGEANVHQVAQVFDAGTAPFMEQIMRELRAIPARLADARESAAGVRRGEEGAKQHQAEFLAQQRALYLQTPQAAINAKRDAENEERNRVASASAWGRHSPDA